MNKPELPIRLLFDTSFLLLRSLIKNQGQKTDSVGSALSVSKGQILFVVAEQTTQDGCGVKLKQIAAQTRQSMSTISEAVDYLVNCELLSRKISDKDRRAIEIGLTQNGRQFIKNHIDNLTKIWQEALISVSPEEQESFFKVLSKVNERLKIWDCVKKWGKEAVVKTKNRLTPWQ